MCCLYENFIFSPPIVISNWGRCPKGGGGFAQPAFASVDTKKAVKALHELIVK